jgi:hypothetical protein
MTKDEFVKDCIRRGYIGRGDGGRSSILGWCKQHPKDCYTEDDLLAIYRYFNSMKIGGRYDAYIKEKERRDTNGG